ncbi:MAG: hypothetical protein HY681_08295 [Chloroflexi bacterium]|nr:hypothetical protein [Chloroflexota bacterium]
MTTLIAWIGVDSRGPASLYFAADSRISWTTTGSPTWDMARKLFATSTQPDIFGYYGDVVFTLVVLSSFVSLVDAGCLFGADATFQERSDTLSDLVKTSFLAYPATQQREFAIIHGARERQGKNCQFLVNVLSWSPANGWVTRSLPVCKSAQSSFLVAAYGSGGKRVETFVENWHKAMGERTSRAIFSAFCDFMNSAGDVHSGGAPQLVGLKRVCAGKTFGVIFKDELFVHGMPIQAGGKPTAMKWVNELFEECDWETKKRRPDSQRQPRPRGL